MDYNDTNRQVKVVVLDGQTGVVYLVWVGTASLAQIGGRLSE